MEFYFEVITDISFKGSLLVKARDVIEAGEKAIQELTRQGFGATGDYITEIKRTKITEVIS